MLSYLNDAWYMTSTINLDIIFLYNDQYPFPKVSAK